MSASSFVFLKVNYDQIKSFYEPGEIESVIVCDDYLYTNTLLGVFKGDEFIGAMCVSDTSGNGLEVHALIRKSKRRYSIQVLKTFRDYVFQTPCEVIYTSVTKGHEYIIKVLKMIGFTVIKSDANITFLSIKRY